MVVYFATKLFCVFLAVSNSNRSRQVALVDAAMLLADGLTWNGVRELFLFKVNHLVDRLLWNAVELTLNTLIGVLLMALIHTRQHPRAQQ